MRRNKLPSAPAVTNTAAETSPPDTAAPAADTGAGASAVLLAAPDVASRLAQREARANRTVMDVAAGRPVPAADLDYAALVFGAAFDGKLTRARAIVAADAEVEAAGQAVTDYAAEGERLRATWREAKAAEAAIGRWTAGNADGWRVVGWLREKAAGDVRSAGIAAEGHALRSGFPEQALAKARARRAALDEASPGRGDSPETPFFGEGNAK